MQERQMDVRYALACRNAATNKVNRTVANRPTTTTDVAALGFGDFGDNFWDSI
jgi:hypothetical protein